MNPFVDVYDRPEVVAGYLDNYLEQPEILLLNEVTQRKSRPDILDLGVGAGRTTFFFAPFAQRYVGVDLAPRMIAACRERFPRTAGPETIEFTVADAVNLAEFEDESFDIVLFSLNGIDCIAPQQRDACLRTIQRVLRPAGTLLFSSHNLQMIDYYFDADATLPADAKAPGLGAADRSAIRIHNPPRNELQAQNQVLFWDGVYGDDGRCKHVYIKPRFQLQELARLGFRRTRALSSLTELTLTDDLIDGSRDPSVHYWCEKNS